MIKLEFKSEKDLKDWIIRNIPVLIRSDKTDKWMKPYTSVNAHSLVIKGLTEALIKKAVK